MNKPLIALIAVIVIAIAIVISTKPKATVEVAAPVAETIAEVPTTGETVVVDPVTPPTEAVPVTAATE